MYKHVCTQFTAKTYAMLSLQILVSSFWKLLTEKRSQAYYFACKFRLKKESGNFITPPKAYVYLPCLMRQPRMLRH